MLEPLVEDMRRLGYPMGQHDFRMQTSDMSADLLLHSLFDGISISHCSVVEYPPRVRDDTLCTDLGKALYKLVDTTCSLATNGFEYCQRTEPRFYESLTRNNYAEEESGFRGPLVLITEGDQVIAIQKNLGEPTILGIEDRPSFGIYRHFVASSLNHLRPGDMNLPPGRNLVIPLEIFGRVIPARPANSIVEPDIRQNIIETLLPGSYWRHGLSFGYEDLVEITKDLLRAAVPFDRKLLKNGSPLRSAIAARQRRQEVLENSI